MMFSDFFLEKCSKRRSYGCLRSQYFLGAIWKEWFPSEGTRQGTF